MEVQVMSRQRLIYRQRDIPQGSEKVLLPGLTLPSE